MLKFMFLAIALITLMLNLALSYYLLRNKRSLPSIYKSNNEIVSFDILPTTARAVETEPTDILDTEVMAFEIKKE